MTLIKVKPNVCYNCGKDITGHWVSYYKEMNEIQCPLCGEFIKLDGGYEYNIKLESKK